MAWQSLLSAVLASQGAQDQLLEAVFARVGTTCRCFVEFGFNSASYEGGSGANTAALYRRGWHGLLLDGSRENATINLHRTLITSANIVALLQYHGVPIEVDYLSIDIDSADLWVLRSILSVYRPRVVTVEYNSNYEFLGEHMSSSATTTPLGAISHALTLPDPATMPILHQRAAWAGTCFYGASAGALLSVARAFGYTLVAVDPPYDLFLVRADLWAQTASSHANISDELTATAARARLRHPVPNHSPMTAEEAANVMEYDVYVQTGSVCEARRAAAITLRHYAALAQRTKKAHEKGVQEPSHKAARYRCFRNLEGLDLPVCATGASATVAQAPATGVDGAEVPLGRADGR